MSGRPTVIMPLEKLARKPTNDGMKIVKKICKLDLAGELVGEASMPWAIGESCWSDFRCSGSD